MANTRQTTSMEDSIRKLTESFVEACQRQNKRIDDQAAIQNKRMDDQAAVLQAIMLQLAEMSSTMEETHATAMQEVTLTNQALVSRISYQLRLEFFRFDGIDPLDWIARAEQFMDFHNAAENQ